MSFVPHFVLLTAAASVSVGQVPQFQATALHGDPLRIEPREGPKPRTRQVVAQSDEVPAPSAATLQAGDGGDVVVAQSGGDPFFTSFVAGRYYPPAGESIDPALLGQMQSAYSDGRPEASTYALVMFSKRITDERKAELERLGCRVLGAHPYYCLKVALPVARVDDVAALDFVRWVGAPQSWQKVHSRLLAELQTLPPGELINVYVDVYDSDLNADTTFEQVDAPQVYDAGVVLEADPPSDPSGQVCHSNGWQQRSLEQLGAQVFEYVDRIHAFRARIAPQNLEALVARDFVLFVEPNLPDELAHDESMPMVLADSTRAQYDGNDSLIALAGQIDSGFDLAHNALNHVNTVGWDETGEGSAIQDNCEHGSHVAGTILGLPVPSMASFTGMAPGLGSSLTSRFRNVKFFDATCTSSSTSHATLFSHMRSNFTDASGNVSPKPHVINNSWGSSATAGNPFFGSEADARSVDAEVWDNSQLYVFAAGNEGTSVGNQSIREEATAKNAFTVGSVVDFRDGASDPGTLTASSSIGPCGDGRWKPNVCAPGKWIHSVDANSGSGFVDKSGTSMAAPHVTGLAAQLCDHISYFRYAPHRLASAIMANALTHNGQTIITPSTNSTNHLNQYGAGLINAADSHWDYIGITESMNWADTLQSNWAGFDDFTVDAGCQRLIVVMTYNEDECSAGAVPALVNDWDLYIDSPTNGIDPAMNTGEYTAQQSSVDNTEIRMILSPPTGTWRWKVYPTSTTSSMRYSITVVQVFANAIQSLDLSVSADELYVQPNQDVEITADVASPNYFASNVYLDSTSSGDALQASTTTLLDGAVTDLMGNQQSGRDVLLGAIKPNDDRSAKWTTRWASEGVKTWSVDARSDNYIDDQDSVQITVDGTPPTQVTNLHSTSHTPLVWSSDSTISMAWTAATDNLSGIDGYSRTWNTGSAATPDQVKDIGAVTSNSANVSDGQWVFAIRAVDKSGNWFAGFTSAGPFRVDTHAPTAPTNLISTSHTMGVQSCNETMTVTWTAATDSLSGIDGYVAIIDTNPTTDPTGAIVIAAGDTSHTENIGSSTSARYLHLRAVDKAGNYGPTAHLGPILINANSVSTYCTGKVNSLGCTPTIGYAGQPSKSSNSFTVVCVNSISQKNGLIFWGSAPLNVPFQGGRLCVAPPTVRTPIASSGGSASGSDCTGQYSFTFDSAYMTTWSLDPGDTVYAQAWMRDPASASHTGLSNGLQFTICQ